MKDSVVEWIGHIPQNWKLVKYKRFAKSGMGITLLKSDVFEKKENNAIPIYSATKEDIFFGYTDNKSLLLEKGDLVIPARGNSIGNIKIVEEQATSTQTTIYSKIFSENIYINFIKYCGDGLKDNWFEFDNTAIPQITVRQVNNNLVPYPDLDEQKKIISILDEKTKKIERLISETKYSIIELKKYKQSIITEAVTKGLNPNVEMKDNDIDWIGKIPKEWNIVKIKYLGTSFNGLTFKPENLVNSSEGVLVLRAGNILNGKLDLTNNIFVTPNIINNNLKLQENDVLICSRSGSRDLIGKNIIIDDELEATFGAFMMVFRSNKVNNKYMYYILNSEVFKYYLGTFLTSTINQLTLRNFDNMRIVFTDDVEEQKDIVQYLDRKTSIIDKLIEDKTKLIEELESYKKSVIYEYVTGKKEA